MSRKLFLFGIGGTGSRVIKSLTMLLASGVKLGNDFEMVLPIIIDPDIRNGDLIRTKDILRLYQEIRREVNKPINFFSQKITTINEINDKSETINPEFFQFNLEGTRDTTFGDYIDFIKLPHDQGKDDRSFINLLFSEKNLNADLDVGFKGNPHMGSVVLDQFTRSKDYEKFTGIFNEGDAIFIINSIFGGTGAAGYPLLLKKLRDEEKFKNAGIGALTVLPYFNLAQKDEINAQSFVHKTVAAIKYYNRTIIGQNKVNFQYFIADNNNNVEEYAVGGEDQKNKAHFVELAGALAILDFCKNIDQNSSEERKTYIKEFGIEKPQNDVITFKHLSEKDRKLFARELSKYKLFTDYLNRRLPKTLGKVRWTKDKFVNLFGKKYVFSPLNKFYFSSVDFEQQVKKFNDYFEEWLRELTENSPSFSPFYDVDIDRALSLIKDLGLNIKGGHEKVDIENNILITNKDIRDGKGKHSVLIKLFDSSLEKMLPEI